MKSTTIRTEKTTNRQGEVQPELIQHEHFKRVCPEHGKKLVKLVKDPRSNWLCRVKKCEYEYPLRVPVASKNVHFRAITQTGHETNGVISRKQFYDLSLRDDIYIEEVF